MQVNRIEIICGLLQAAMLSSSPAIANSASDRLTIGATVVSPCTITPSAPHEAKAGLLVKCANAIQAKPQIINKASPLLLANAKIEPEAQLHTEIIF